MQLDTKSLQQLSREALTFEMGELILRPFVASDASPVAALAADRRIAEMTLRVPHPYSFQDAQQWISDHPAHQQAGEELNWAIVRASRGELVGTIGLAFHLGHRRGALGYWIGAPYWRRGYASAAAMAIVRFAFAAGVEKLTAECLASNVGSIAVLRRCGFEQEGLLRGHHRRQGIRQDLRVFGLLRPG